MCSGGSAPKAPAPLPEAPRSAGTPAQGAGASFREAVQKKRGQSMGGTLLTGPSGLQSGATTQTKTLLGA